MQNQRQRTVQPGHLSSRGFTLIELLVTMAIASIVLAATISIYTGLSRSYTTETARAAAQQDIRAGMAVMIQDIRLAGLDPMKTGMGGITLNNPTDITIIADRDYNGAVTVGNMEEIRYYLAGDQLMQSVDNGGDEVLVDDITALNFNLITDGGTPQMVVINMTVTVPAGRTGTVARTLTERVRLRNY